MDSRVRGNDGGGGAGMALRPFDRLTLRPFDWLRGAKLRVNGGGSRQRAELTRLWAYSLAVAKQCFC